MSHPEFTLLLQLLQDPVQHPDSLPKDIINWQTFYTLVIRHRVWYQIQKTNLFKNTATSITQPITHYCQHHRTQLLAIVAETRRVAAAFEQQQIQHCFVKGIVLNVHLYKALDARPCRDIDVWVRLEDYEAAMTQLIALGYHQQLPAYELTGFKRRYFFKHYHDIAFYHPQHRVLVELHFSLDSLGTPFFALSSVKLQSIKLFNQSVLTLHDDEHLLFLMMHGAIHAWIRLRWLQDIAIYIQTNQCDLQRVMQLAKQINVEHIVEQSLLLVHEFFHITHAPLQQLLAAPSRRAQQLAKTARQFILADYTMQTSVRNIRMFTKYRFYLAKLAISGHKISTVFADLFKIDRVFTSITFPKLLSFMYYLVYPFWVITFIVTTRREKN